VGAEKKAIAPCPRKFLTVEKISKHLVGKLLVQNAKFGAKNSDFGKL